jgi:hypothetical protein
MDLQKLVEDFTEALVTVDKSGVQHKQYRPGIGPHSENEAVRLIAAEMKRTWPDRYPTYRLQMPYPNDARRKCDLVLGSNQDWAIEVKLARFIGDKAGADDPQSIKRILSPFEIDHSALTDCSKLVTAGFSSQTHKVVLIYGFDDLRPDADEAREHHIARLIEAFEILANTRVTLGTRCEASFDELIHPVHRIGGVFAWEVTPRDDLQN